MLMEDGIELAWSDLKPRDAKLWNGSRAAVEVGPYLT